MRYIIPSMLLAALLVVPVLSQAQAPGKTWQDWNFCIDLYFPSVNISGDAAITVPDGDPMDIPIGLRFRDIVDNYRGGLSGIFMAKKRWSINLDLSYARLESEQSVTLPNLEFDPPYMTVTFQEHFHAGRIRDLPRLPDQ